MGVQITTAFVQQYSTTVGMLLQQQGSRFRAHVREQACFGQAATYMEQFGKVNGVKNLARNSDTPIVGTPRIGVGSIPATMTGRTWWTRKISSGC